MYILRRLLTVAIVSVINLMQVSIVYIAMVTIIVFVIVISTVIFLIMSVDYSWHRVASGGWGSIAVTGRVTCLHPFILAANVHTALFLDGWWLEEQVLLGRNASAIDGWRRVHHFPPLQRC